MNSNTVTQPESMPVTTQESRLILIIDDDVDQADVLRHRLSSQGYTTQTAYCGKDGLQFAVDEHPDLVLLDLRLPDLDGFDVCKVLADNPQTCDIPVVILSGMERPDVIRRSRSSGGQFYVRKPYDPNVLLVLIQTALGQSATW